MSSTKLHKRLQQVLRKDELPLFRLLLVDPKTKVLLANKDFRSLAKMYGVSMFTFEDSYLWKRRVRLNGNNQRFKITHKGVDVLDVEDDPMGTVGCNAVQRLQAKVACSLPSKYLSGSRPKTSLPQALVQLDSEKLKAAVAILPKLDQPSARFCKAVTRATAALADLTIIEAAKNPLTEHLSCAVVDAALSLCTELRSRDAPIKIPGAPCPTATVPFADLMAQKVSDVNTVCVLPMNGQKFTDFEKQVFSMMNNGLAVRDDGGSEVAFVATFDVFEVVSDRFREPCILPPVEDYKLEEEIEGEAYYPPPEDEAAAVVAYAPEDPEGSYWQEVEGYLRDYFKMDHSRVPREDLQKIKAGGLGEDARAAWADLSKKKQAAFMQCLGSVPVRFREFVAISADANKIEVSKAFAYVCASKLICSKGCLSLATDGMVIARRK